MKQLLIKYWNNEISLRKLIGTIKSNDDYIQYIEAKTNFLNDYNVDILERIYYIINDIHDVVKCKYCNNKAKFSGRIKDGYKLTCCSKLCETKRISELKLGNTIVSNNRNNKFIIWQNNITKDDLINDEFIKNNIKYDKFISLLTNQYIINYLQNRFKDSSSLLESYQRIKLGIEEKPKCPICGKPVNWIGKKSKLYTTYCSNTCAGNSQLTKERKSNSQLEKWGNCCCFNSEKYKHKLKQKYGVEYISQRKDVILKRKQTFLEKYGVEYVSLNEEIKNKIWKTCKEHMSFCTSKEELNIAKWLKELGYNFEQHYKSKIYPFNCDFYLIDYDIYLEYQGSQFHKGYSYLNTNEDIIELNRLKLIVNKKLLINKKPLEQGIIETWSIRDVKKRETALKNKVKLLEIYKCKSINDLNNQLNIFIDSFKNKDKNHQLYATNPIIRRSIIQNCCKVLNKKESELTEDDIFNNFIYKK